MSHDENSQALARWLDQPPGTEPPDDLDADVVEAIHAIRPDLAPAPRVSADEILGLVSAGPLAPSQSEQGGDVVPFPRAPEPEGSADHATPDLPPRWSSLARWGGLSGVGIALAAAATLFMVAVPTLNNPSAPPAQSEAMPAGDELRAAPAAAGDAAPTAADEPADEPPAELAEEEAAPPPAPAAEPPEAARRRPSPRPVAEPKAAAPPPSDAYEMGGTPAPNDALIPELEETLDADDDAVADAEAPPAGRGEADDGASSADLAALKAAAVPSDWSATGWQGAVSSADRDRVLAFLAQAEEAASSGDAAQAADLAARAISPPDAAAHAAALAAFRYYLEAGDQAGAISAARRGLAYRSPTPAWSKLAVALGDLLRANAPDEAAAWYRDAAANNALR